MKLSINSFFFFLLEILSWHHLLSFSDPLHSGCPGTSALGSDKLQACSVSFALSWIHSSCDVSLQLRSSSSDIYVPSLESRLALWLALVSRLQWKWQCASSSRHIWSLALGTLLPPWQKSQRSWRMCNPVNKDDPPCWGGSRLGCPQMTQKLTTGTGNHPEPKEVS